MQTTFKGLEGYPDPDFIEAIYKANGLVKEFEKLKAQTRSVLFLGDLAEHYGINCEERKIYCRGHIHSVKYETIEKEDKHLLTVETDTAWEGCHSLFNAINEVLGNELSISFREYEPMTEYFCIHDEGGFFPQKCVASINDGCCLRYVYFDTIKAAIHQWCSMMGVERGDKSEEEMVEYINNYVYTEGDNYFFIHEITFV